MRQERGNSAEAGRALNERVAREVMGWGDANFRYAAERVSPTPNADETVTHATMGSGDWTYEQAWMRSERENAKGNGAIVGYFTPVVANVPEYSSDIASAFQVVAEVQSRFPGMRFSLLGGDECWGYRHSGATDYDGQPVYECVTTRREVFGWRARFFGGEDPTKHYPVSWADEHADTIPLAICLAALKAIESGSREGNR